jgi:hypothetical protein
LQQLLNSLSKIFAAGAENEQSPHQKVNGDGMNRLPPSGRNRLWLVFEQGGGLVLRQYAASCRSSRNRRLSASLVSM